MPLRELTRLSAAEAWGDWGVPPGDSLEAFRGGRGGQRSIRIKEGD